MTIDSAIAYFREKQAEQFTTSVIVYRAVGESWFNPETEEHEQDQEVVYSGPCKIRPSKSRSADEVNAAETLIGQPDSEGKFPVDTALERNDVIVVTADRHDATLIGRAFRVTKAPGDTWQISKVAQLTETLPPLLNEES